MADIDNTQIYVLTCEKDFDDNNEPRLVLTKAFKDLNKAKKYAEHYNEGNWGKWHTWHKDPKWAIWRAYCDRRFWTIERMAVND